MSEQSAGASERVETGGWCFSCTETYSHDEWITRRYRTDRGHAKSGAFCPHCGRLQVSTRLAEDLIDGELPDRGEVLEGYPEYLTDFDTETAGDGE